ncbi:hypothetical protein PCK2_000711, partial [Pneumocystis canis]
KQPLQNIHETLASIAQSILEHPEENVSTYFNFFIIKSLLVGQKFPKDSPQRFLSDVSFSCICHLLLSIPHFNYRTTLIDIISTKLTQKMPDTSFIECKKTIEKVFKNDTEGRISLEIVKKLTSMIKKKNYNISDSILNTFLHLEILSQSNLTVSQTNAIDSRKRKHEKQFKSKKLRKLEKEKKQIEREMDGNEQSNDEKEKFQGEILKLIFTTYFQILQSGLATLIYACLEGLKKNPNLSTASAFIKRLFTVLLGFPEKSTLKSLNLIQKLIKKHPKLNYLLTSNEKYGDGVYNGEIDNPDLSNSYLSTCWELVLLTVNPSDIIPPKCLIRQVISFLKTQDNLQKYLECLENSLLPPEYHHPMYDRVDKVYDAHIKRMQQESHEIASINLSYKEKQFSR